MRSDSLYLNDILEACDAIEQFLDGREEEEFLSSDLLQSAVLAKPIMIGEGAARVSEGMKEQSGTIPWNLIVGFRNIAVHEYFSLDWGMVWRISRRDVPNLSQALEAVMQKEFPETFREYQARKKQGGSHGKR